MTLAASVLLIVVGISTATHATVPAPPVSCLCERSGKEIVASDADWVNVRTSRIARSATHDRSSSRKAFSWVPLEDERKWVYLVIHHSATSGGSVESIHQEHRRRKDSRGLPWLGVGYHFVVGNGVGMQDGSVEPTFRWRQQIHGAHSGSAVHNANGIGICLIGNFEHNKPTVKQVAAVTDLIGQLARRYKIPSRLVIGHNTVKPTACPGSLFPLQDVKRKSFADFQISDRSAPSSGVSSR